MTVENKDNLLALYEKYRSEEKDENFEAIQKSIDRNMKHVLKADGCIPNRQFTI